ncbi:MAG: hypothetical protein QM793_07230 [Muricomes sp.]
MAKLFGAATPAIYHAYYLVLKPLIMASVLFIAVFAVGACIFTCFFSVNETKDMVTSSSKIHYVGSAIGFMLFFIVYVSATWIYCSKKHLGAEFSNSKINCAAGYTVNEVPPIFTYFLPLLSYTYLIWGSF